jgi:hypothetical protein
MQLPVHQTEVAVRDELAAAGVLAVLKRLVNHRPSPGARAASPPARP